MRPRQSGGQNDGGAMHAMIPTLAGDSSLGTHSCAAGCHRNKEYNGEAQHWPPRIMVSALAQYSAARRVRHRPPAAIWKIWLRTADHGGSRGERLIQIGDQIFLVL